MGALNGLSQQFATPLLPSIRTDSTVTKAARAKKLLNDFDSHGKAAEDYRIAFDQLFERLKDQVDGRQLALETQA